MSLFSNQAIDAGSASLFSKPVKRDDLLNQAREKHQHEPSQHDDQSDSELSNVEDSDVKEAESISEKAEDSSEVANASNDVSDDGSDAEAAAPEANDNKADDMERTLFVKNVPYSVITDKKVFRAFRRLFEPGVKSLRFRSIAMSEMMPRKAAFIKQKLHPSRDAVNSYVVYHEADRVYEAMHQLNGREFAEHHLFVDHAAHPRQQDAKRSVFVGNLPFEASEEALYNHFKDCGPIENLRIVRDPQFNIGKGFAYVQFEDVSTVQVALLKSAEKFENRELRVTRCQSKVTKKASRPAQKPLYQRKNEPKKRRRRERVDESGMVLEGERAKQGKPGIDKKRRHRKDPGKSKKPRRN